MDYTERPVSIDQFIEDPYFLGTITKNGKAIYPIWRNFARELFSDNRIHIGVLTGAIGVGKTYIAYIAVAYALHRILLLKDPWAFFDLAPGAKMAVSFFNLTKTLGESKGYKLLTNMLLSSRWFTNGCCATVKGKEENQTIHFPLINWVLSSPYARGFGTQGESVIISVMDELDDPNESAGQKKRVVQAFDSTRQRFLSRFVIDGESLGKMLLVASKQDELSFLNTFVDKMKDDSNTLIYDVPRWEAKPDSHYSGKKFFVALGDAFTPSKVLNDATEIDQAQIDGYKIIEIPIEFEKEFRRDLIGSLRDIGGIAVQGTRKHKLFSSEKFIKDCFDETLENPIKLETIHIGLKDAEELIQYFDADKIVVPRYIPRSIHLDIALSGDALGLAMSGIADWTIQNVLEDDGTYSEQKVPIIQTDFAMRLKAKPNDEVPLFKVRKFVLDLIALGFNITRFSADLRLASADTFQLLERKGITTKYLSLDKTPKVYNDYKNIVLEKRWRCFAHKYLFFELKHLEWNRDTNKVDHPDEVKEMFIDEGVTKEFILVGSKDVADGVAGSVAGALEQVKGYVDSKVVKAAIENAMEKITTTQDDFSWLLGIDKKQDKKEIQKVAVNNIDKSAQQLFIDILKRSN